MKPINQIIAEGKRLCDGAIGVTNDLVNRQVPIEEAGEPEEYEKFLVYHNPEQMKHLYETLERAIEVIKYYGSRENWFPAGDRKSAARSSDTDTENGLRAGGKHAREFLASIEKRGDE